MGNKEKSVFTSNSNEKMNQRKSSNGPNLKGSKNVKTTVEQKNAIPEALKEVKSFLMAEMNKSGTKEIGNQNILYLKENQLISSEKKTFMNLTSGEVNDLKMLIRDVISEELDKRGLNNKI